MLLSFIVISRPCAADVMQSLPPTVETPNTEQLEQFGSIEFCKVEATVTYWGLIGCDIMLNDIPNQQTLISLLVASRVFESYHQV